MASYGDEDRAWMSNEAEGQGINNELLGPMAAQAPQHPISTMQGAFEESMLETLSEEKESDIAFSKKDSVYRRKMLLERPQYERTVAGRWRQRPGEKFHPLWKLVSQISFGMHLLQQGLAKSDEEVIKILQNHVDEIDGFLERTTEDFDLAQNDIQERIRYLKLPLEHGEVFDTMLDDRQFRTAIVEGNEKIEHIVDRTSSALRDALKDVKKGFDGTRELARYLRDLGQSWQNVSDDNAEVYKAMMGNTEGWAGAYTILQEKGKVLHQSLRQLTAIISEIQRRVGIASRRNLPYVPPMRSNQRSLSQSTSTSRVSISPPQSPSRGIPTNNARVSVADRRAIGQRALSTAIQSPDYDVPLWSGDKEKKMGQYQYGGSSREKAPRPHSRRVSLSDRTRSLTRKLSLFGGSSENLTKMPKSPPNGPRTVVRPRDDYPIYKPKLQARPNDTYQPIRKRTTLTSPYSPYDLDYLLHVTPSDTTMSPLRDSDMRGMPSARSFASPLSGGGRYGPLSAPLLNDIVPEETSEDEDEEEEDPLNHEHPLVQDIRAKEVRFSSTNSGAPLKPTLRELPLRGFRSQENLVKETEPPIKRSSTIHETPTAATSPSIYSTDGRKESTTTQLIDAIAIASMPQRSSVHYTQPTDSAFISPPPIMSATPSPLHFNKPANEVLQPRTDSLEPFRSGQPPQQVTPPRGGSPPLTFATISGPEPDFPYFPSPEPSLHSTAASTIKAEEEESSLAPAALNTLPASPSPHVQDHPRTDYRTRQQAARANAAPLKLFPQADARLQAQMAAPRSPATLGVPHLNDSKHPRSPWKKVFSPFKRKKSKDHENISHFTSNEYVPPDMQSRTSLETNDTRGKSSFEKHNKHIEITPTPIINITTHTPDPNIHNKREQRLSPLVENGLLSKSAITPRSPSPANGSRENIPGFRTAYGGSSAASNALVDKSIGPKRGHRKSRSERLAPLLTMGMLDPDAARRKSEESNRADLSPGGGSGWVRTPGKVREGRPF